MTDTAPAAAPHTVTVTRDAHSTVYTVTIPTMEHHQEPGIIRPAVGLYAILRVTGDQNTRPASYHLSMLVGETDWTVDAKFGTGSFPHWSNGFGARYLKTKTMPDEFAQVLDRAAHAAGLVQQIGRQTPLILAPTPA